MMTDLGNIKLLQPKEKDRDESMRHDSRLHESETSVSLPDDNVPLAALDTSVEVVAQDTCGETTSKNLLFAIGVVTTSLQGGGLIFGASAFQSTLLVLPNTPFNSQTVGTVFTIGHNLTAIGCILSGFLLDRFGPRVCVVSGLLIEAVGHFLLVFVTSIPPWVTCAGYGAIGLGGCQVLLGALTFADAFERPAMANSILTAAFSAGGFVFMILPFVPWCNFFSFYVIFCLLGAVLTSALYPDSPLPAYAVEEESDRPTEMSTASEETLSSIVMRPGTMLFLLTFTISGSALVYGLGEFVAATKDKDHCQWDELLHDFVRCKHMDLERSLDVYWMPFVGNFILPCSLLLGWLIDTFGFTVASFVNIFSVQLFILCVWLCPLDAEYFTLLVYNVANTAVFTVQNAYICSNGHAHIGALFSISNLTLGIGNILSDYLNYNPFGSGEKAISTSIKTSCLLWICSCMVLYAWPIMEFIKTSRAGHTYEECCSPRLVMDVAESVDDATSMFFPDCGINTQKLIHNVASDLAELDAVDVLTDSKYSFIETTCEKTEY